MNSRDAAYDEDEMLRRAIKESKEMGTLGKRVREDSEEYATIVYPGSFGGDYSPLVGTNHIRNVKELRRVRNPPCPGGAAHPPSQRLMMKLLRIQ